MRLNRDVEVKDQTVAQTTEGIIVCKNLPLSPHVLIRFAPASTVLTSLLLTNDDERFHTEEALVVNW